MWLLNAQPIYRLTLLTPDFFSIYYIMLGVIEKLSGQEGVSGLVISSNVYTYKCLEVVGRWSKKDKNLSTYRSDRQVLCSQNSPPPNPKKRP